ncbi:MAG TPA: glycosyltransferase family 4 protein [Acidimicrobiales bacterium]|nr:glycosyltransferase family 4 protein [Acidimicrobiales bacterium]
MVRVAMLAPIAWPSPPRGYGPWEQVVATLTDALIELGAHVTLYATGDSATRAELRSVVPHGYEEDDSYDVKVYEALHIARVFEEAGEHDLIHNHFDFLPLAWSRFVETPLVTTIHGFSSERVLPAYRAYDDRAYYVAISHADRHPDLTYAATVYHGIDLDAFAFRADPDPDGHLVSFARIHPDKGTAAAIDIARAAERPIRLAGIIHDQDYFNTEVKPRLGADAEYVGPVEGPDRARFLGSAAALVHPVAFAEPFGLSVVEAFACGTPVVAYRKGALVELVRPGVNGFLAGGAEEAVSALGMIGTIDRASCRRDAEERFSAQRMAADYLAVYQSILGVALPGTGRHR